MVNRSTCCWAAAFVAAVFLVMSARGTPLTNFLHTDCNSTAQVHSITIDPCIEPENMIGGCKLFRGRNHTVTIVFTPDILVRALQHIIIGQVFGAELPLPGIRRGSSNACASVGGCPLQAGTNVTYSFNVFINARYPRFAVPIQYRLVANRLGTSIVCFKVQSKISNYL